MMCPECGVELVACPGDLIAGEVFLCEECDTRWVVCPDCGEMIDADEDWDVEQGVCVACADSNEGIQVFVLNKEHSPEELHKFLENVFGDD